MKKIILCLMLACSFVTRAQDVPEPEFSSRPYMISVEGSLKNFERIDQSIEMGANSLGRNWKTYYIAHGAKSTCRVSKGAIPRCIIKIEPGKDPADLVRLFKGIIKKKDRKFLTGGRPEDLSESTMKIEFKKLRDGIYEILLPNLEAGEYLFTSMGDMKLSCFGVD